DNNVAVLDLYKNRQGKVISGGVLPGSLGATPDGGLLFVGKEGSNEGWGPTTASPRNVVAKNPVGTTPVPVNISPNGQFVYAVNQDNGTVSVIDASQNRVVGSPLSVGSKPNQIAIAANVGTAYVVNSGSSSITPVNLSTNQPGAPIGVGAGPVI